MGTRNANRCRGLDRTEASEMIIPEGLIDRLDLFSRETADDPRAAAIKEAADVLRALPGKMSDGKRLESELFAAKGYRIDTNLKDKELRIPIYGAVGNKQVLAYLVLTSPEAYEMAQLILKNYDLLE